MNIIPDMAATLANVRRHHVRVYGGCTITANVLLILKGMTSHDPFMIGAGIATATAQALNLAVGTPVKPYTFPAIIVGALVFMAGGIHHGMVDDAHGLGEAMHRILNPQTWFGGIKALGASILFYGRAITARLGRKTTSALRLTYKVASKIDPARLGEVILGLAAVSLGIDGFNQLHRGLNTLDQTAMLNGVVTLGAVLGLLIGQHYAARIPVETAMPTRLPRLKPSYTAD